jgi:hypothetical protein
MLPSYSKQSYVVQSMRPVLKPVTHASDMKGEDNIIVMDATQCRGHGMKASYTCMLMDITEHPRSVSTLVSVVILYQEGTRFAS